MRPGWQQLAEAEHQADVDAGMVDEPVWMDWHGGESIIPGHPDADELVDTLLGSDESPSEDRAAELGEILLDDQAAELDRERLVELVSEASPHTLTALRAACRQ